MNGKEQGEFVVVHFGGWCWGYNCDIESVYEVYAAFFVYWFWWFASRWFYFCVIS